MIHDYYAPDALREVTTMADQYTELMDYLFTNSSRQGKETEEYTICIDVMNNMSKVSLSEIVQQ